MFHHLIASNKSVAEVKAETRAIEEEVGVGWRAEEPRSFIHQVHFVLPAPVDDF